MGPISHYPRNGELMRKTWGGSAKEVTESMKQPLRGRPYNISYRKSPQLFGRPNTGRKQIRW